MATSKFANVPMKQKKKWLEPLGILLKIVVIVVQRSNGISI